MSSQTINFKILDNLAEELVKAGMVTRDQLAVARVTQKTLGGDIGHILVKKGFVTEAAVLKFIGEHLQIPFVQLKDQTIDPAAVKAVPVSLALKYHLIPIAKEKDTLTIAMADPLELFALDEIKMHANFDLKPVLASKDAIESAIKEHYRIQEGSISQVEESIEIVDHGWGAEDEVSTKLEELASGPKVVGAVNGIIIKAFNEHASDIHIEPMQDTVKVRYRIDGLLEERLLLPKNMHLPIVSRLKIMTNMDIAERRVPQDGRVRLKLLGNELDLRLSTYPAMHGEKVVIRLLAKEGMIRLEDLGFDKEDKARFEELILKPHGMFLVTGPTGSGKTTTLYAALQRVNSQDKNIISVEDPIENEIKGVNQAQVNPKAGLTFASALRSILRQDPNIIMIGEIRDRETADIAVRAAMTGHLVFSTLHTNTAVGAIARLVDLGVEPFLLSSALLGVLAQRLVRVVCPKCAYEVEGTPDEARYLGVKPPVKLKKGKGCKACRMSGYKGRSGIFELVVVNDKIRRLMVEKAPEEEIKKEVSSMGVLDIRQDGINKVLKGITTLEEVIRVTEE